MTDHVAPDQGCKPTKKTISREVSKDEAVDLAIGFITEGRWADAYDIAGKIHDLDPNHTGALYVMGRVAEQAGKAELALNLWQQAAEGGAVIGELYFRLFKFNQHQNDMETGRQLLQRCLDLDANHAEALQAMGNYYLGQDDKEESLDCFARAAASKPHDESIVFSHGYGLHGLERWAEAIEVYSRVLNINPDDEATLKNIAYCYIEYGNLGGAISNLERLLSLTPDDRSVQYTLVDLYNRVSWYKKAEELCDQVLADSPDDIIILDQLSLTHHLVGRPTKVRKIQKKLVTISPGSPELWNSYLFTLDYDPEILMEQSFEEFKQFDQIICRPYEARWKPHTNIPDPDRRLKVGYMSPDYGNHSLRYVLEPVLRLHNRDEFEVYGLAHIPHDKPNCERVKSYVDHWVTTADYKPEELAEMIRDWEIDILVDASGHGAGNDLLVMAQKPAPVSITTMGFGRTTGVSAIDYCMFPTGMAPAEFQDYFAETIWSMSKPGVCFDHTVDDIGDVSPSPAKKNDYVTFATFTRSIRMNERIFNVWSQILKRMPTSKLVLNSPSLSTVEGRQNVIDLFAKFDIGEDRLDIGCDSPPWDKYREVDIVLDCFPHNCGATLSEALYLGIPYVTLIDRPGIGRQGLVILDHAGHTEWAVDTEAAYVEKAVELASDIEGLSETRKNLRDDCHQHGLLDLEGFVRNLESDYRKMWQIWCQKDGEA